MVIIMINEITIKEFDYLIDLKQIKETIRTNQNKAMVVVNSTMILTYYEIDLLFYHIPTHSYVVIELKTIKNIAISKYKFMEELPEYLEKRLKEM